MTNFRALCAELAEALNTNDYYNEISDEMFYSGLLNRARAALAEPEPLSLKRRALGALSRADKDALTNPLTGEVVALRTILSKDQADTIRRALEALPE